MGILTILIDLVVEVKGGEVGDVALLEIVDGLGQDNAQQEDQNDGGLHTCTSLIINS